jgi:hypothetical protein
MISFLRSLWQLGRKGTDAVYVGIVSPDRRAPIPSLQAMHIDIDPDSGGTAVLPSAVRHYYETCEKLGWAPRPWNCEAREFTKLTARRKVYRWFRADNRTMHRRRVYPIMRSDPGVESEQVAPQRGDLSPRAASRTAPVPTMGQAYAASRMRTQANYKKLATPDSQSA